MMLMTKFGKFKLRLIATINLSVLLSIFNIASTTSNYWLKYIDQNTGETHFAGIWRSCQNTANSECIWKAGIVEKSHSIWSTVSRFFILFGTFANICAIFIFFLAFLYKLNKKTKCVLKLMEVGNFTLIGAFCSILIGFTVLISNKCNFSVWLHVFSMLLIIFTSNMITRTFAKLYFVNTRTAQCSKSVEAAISHSKLTAAADAEEKIALAPIIGDSVVDQAIATAVSNAATIEMSKVNETNGSSEALIQQPAGIITTNTVPTTVAVIELTNTNQEA